MARARSLIALGSLACAVTVAAPAPAATSRTEQRLIDAVNEFRHEHGLRPLRGARSLSRTSDRAARRILRTGELRHSRPINRRYRRAGENLAWQGGRTRDVWQVVRMWAGSRSHRSVMLRRGVRWIGTGQRYGKLRGGRSTVWVLQVGGR